MDTRQEKTFKRLGGKWLVKPAFLKDIYFLMLNDLRFSSMRGNDSVRFSKVSKHLKDNYQIEIKPAQLKYLVFLIKSNKSR